MNKEIEKRIHEFAGQMYDAGYAEGTRAHDGERGSIYYGGYSDGYKDGLIVAWECVRKMVDDYSASEAIAKIKEYETAKCCRTCKEVEDDSN